MTKDGTNSKKEWYETNKDAADYYNILGKKT